MGTLSDMAFLRDNPQAVCASSPFTGVFYNSGDGVWRDLTRYLPGPFTPVSALGIDCEGIYVGTEGRGLMRITGYDNAPAASAPPGSLLRIISVSPGPSVTIMWQSSPGTTYRVQFKENLTDPGWTDLNGDVLANCLTASKTDSSSSQHRFYRIFQLP